MTEALRDKTILLTGASRGIGRAMALELAAAGARVALAARSAVDLGEVAAECKRRGGETLLLPVDVGVPEDCRRAVDKTVEEFGRLDVLILNAGISMVARFETLADLEPLERIMRVNYFGAVYPLHHGLPHLLRSRGRILAVASLAALAAVPTRTGYVASKRALAGFCDSLRVELAGTGVSVTVVYPGFVETGIRERAAGAGAGRGVGKAAGRVISAEECARRSLAAGAARRREVVFSARGRAARWLGLLAPRLLDRLAARAVGVPYPPGRGG